MASYVLLLVLELTKNQFFQINMYYACSPDVQAVLLHICMLYIDQVDRTNFNMIY